MMLYDFSHLRLISLLRNSIDLLDSNEDKSIVTDLIKKYSPSDNHFIFSPDKVASVSNRMAGFHSKGVHNAMMLAVDYVKSCTRIDFYDDELYDINMDFYYHIHDDLTEEKEELHRNFCVIRYLVSSESDEIIRKDAIKSYDIYVTNLYIKFFNQCIEKYSLSKGYTTKDFLKSISQNCMRMMI